MGVRVKISISLQQLVSAKYTCSERWQAPLLRSSKFNLILKGWLISPARGGSHSRADTKKIAALGTKWVAK
jgi:hypothetical protein